MVSSRRTHVSTSIIFLFVIFVSFVFVFFFNDPAPTEIYTLSLHDALPIFVCGPGVLTLAYELFGQHEAVVLLRRRRRTTDRKSTRLNSSHITISYAVFCLKKKKKNKKNHKIAL